MLTAYVVTNIMKRNVPVSLVIVFLLTASGILNLIVVKNDYQFRVTDAPKDPFIEWIKISTPIDSIFLSKQNLYDPVTLAGRKNFMGATYYSEVMGYDVAHRAELVQILYESPSIDQFRKEGIDYVVVPDGPTDNFIYSIDRQFFDSFVSVYKDKNVSVYKI